MSTASHGPAGWRRHGAFALASLAALGLLFAAYANHFDNGFHFDDSHVIVNNIAIRSLSNLGRYFTDATTFTARPENASYRPLLTLSYALDYKAWGGLSPRGFHRTQFALLILLGVLLVVFYSGLANRIERSAGNRYFALFAATLFCVHTANSETVNYLSSRSSLVGTLGVVASFVVYIYWERGRKTLLYLLPMLICGLAKPLTVMFAPLLVVYVFLFEEQGSCLELFRKTGLLKAVRSVLRGVPALVLGGALFVFLRAMEPSTLQYAVISRWRYMITQPFVWLHYFRLYLWPRGLTADTDWKFLDSWKDARVFAGLAFILLLVLAVAWLSGFKRWRPTAFGLAWVALALLPTSSIFPLSEVYNEHRIFFPYVGLTLAFVWSAWMGLRAALGDRRRVATAVVVAVLAAAVLLAHAAGTHRRNEVWRDDLTLWEDVASKSPRNGRGLMNYGLALMSRGRIEEALELFERARVFNPNYSILEINLAVAKNSLGREEEAERHYRRSLEISPRYAQGRYFYANWLVKHGRGPEAIEHLEQGLRFSNWDMDVREMLLRLYDATGKEDALARLIASTLQIAPVNRTALELSRDNAPTASAEKLRQAGRARLDRKLWIDAAKLNRRSLRLEPDSAVAWNNLGWALANLGFYRESIPCFARAYELDPAMDVARANQQWARTEAARANARGRGE